MMEGLSPLHRRVAGIDVHRMLHVVTVLIEQPDGSIDKHSREFGGFKRDCRALAAWLAELQVQLVVMESTGIYWKSVFAGRGRDGDYSPPPAQIRTCGTTAYGSCLES
jgi:hypothetical protein